MRLYEPLSYLNSNHNNNNNNNNNYSHANDIIDRDCYSNGNSIGNTVKTFTSNGNQQSNIDSVTVTSPKAATTTSTHFEINSSPSSSSSSSSVGCDVLNENWQLETEFSKALSALNETYCFYGSHRKLKSREHLDCVVDEDGDDDTANGNGNFVNSIEQSSKADTVDLIDGSSSDIEAEINRLISRSNLCRQNFECESYKDVTPPNTEEQLMDEEGMQILKQSIFTCLLYTSPSPRDATLSRMPSSA